MLVTKFDARHVKSRFTIQNKKYRNCTANIINLFNALKGHYIILFPITKRLCTQTSPTENRVIPEFPEGLFDGQQKMTHFN